MEHFIWATAIGAISAVSFPLGSWMGLRFNFSRNAISMMAAFGGGALLAALSVEMVAPATLALVDGGSDGHAVTEFMAMVLGCVAGGILYVVLDHLVNQQGGFLRRPSTILRHYEKLAQAERERVLERVAAHPLFRDFPTDRVETLLGKLERVEFEDGDVVVEEGQHAREVFLILEGVLEATFEGKHAEDFGPEKLAVGLLPVFTGQPYPMTGTAKGHLKCLRISRENLDELRRMSPGFNRSCEELALKGIDSLQAFLAQRRDKEMEWLDASRQSLYRHLPAPETPFLRKAGEEHHGAPLAVWIGILLDGIPESVVIGAGVFGILSGKLAATGAVAFGDVIPFTLVAGLFLANFPEALSSSASMRAQGWSNTRTFLMWFSLLVITSVGAGFGFLLAETMSHTWMGFIEGLAAGAMLTMIAAAMIPEAVLMGSGNRVGLSTLAGFLAAILFKLLE